MNTDHNTNEILQTTTHDVHGQRYQKLKSKHFLMNQQDKKQSTNMLISLL